MINHSTAIIVKPNKENRQMSTIDTLKVRNYN